jgi:hypothetical protein
MRALRFAALVALASACQSESTAPRNAPALATASFTARAIAGRWAGSYPTDQPIIYTFTYTGTRVPNSRTGHLSWYYTATYEIGGAAPVPFDVFFEPPVAYWGAISSGTLQTTTKMRVLGAARPFVVLKQRQ